MDARERARRAARESGEEIVESRKEGQGSFSFLLSTLYFLSPSGDRPDSPIPMPRRFAPDTGNLRLALRAFTSFAQTIFRHQKSRSANDRSVAVMTSRVFPFVNLARQIPRINIFQTRSRAGLDNSHQIIRRRMPIPIRHFVIRMKRRHMPRH